MMNLKICTLLLVTLSVHAARKVEWNTLKVKWGPDPLLSNDDVYIRQPRTVQQALQEQYEKLPNGLGDRCIGKESRREAKTMYHF